LAKFCLLSTNAIHQKKLLSLLARKCWWNRPQDEKVLVLPPTMGFPYNLIEECDNWKLGVPSNLKFITLNQKKLKNIDLGIGFTWSVCNGLDTRRPWQKDDLEFLDPVFFPHFSPDSRRSCLNLICLRIPTCNQFHKYFTTTFCANFILQIKLQTQIVSTEELWKTPLWEKLQMLLKLTPVVNFTKL